MVLCIGGRILEKETRKNDYHLKRFYMNMHSVILFILGAKRKKNKFFVFVVF